mmetsp:Transcript_27500/g.87392  ORF Transcript_27500/g.87392 Transcript_27500/m.87392 type:complete len:252 (+) Transcript_27500:357-1112(+)
MQHSSPGDTCKLMSSNEPAAEPAPPAASVASAAQAKDALRSSTIGCPLTLLMAAEGPLSGAPSTATSRLGRDASTSGRPKRSPTRLEETRPSVRYPTTTGKPDMGPRRMLTSARTTKMLSTVRAWPVRAATVRMANATAVGTIKAMVVFRARSIKYFVSSASSSARLCRMRSSTGSTQPYILMARMPSSACLVRSSRRALRACIWRRACMRRCASFAVANTKSTKANAPARHAATPTTNASNTTNMRRSAG